MKHTSPTQFLSEVVAGHDGPTIPTAKRAYFQERFRGRIFEFLLQTFLREQQNGLSQAKLSRRIGKTPDVINRWLGSPSNLTIDTISDLLLGMSAEEMEPTSKSLLNREPVNFAHTDLESALQRQGRNLSQPKQSALRESYGLKSRNNGLLESLGSK